MGKVVDNRVVSELVYDLLGRYWRGHTNVRAVST